MPLPATSAQHHLKSVNALKSERHMRKKICFAALLFATTLGTTGCHIANATAGRPAAEDGDGIPGSVTASKAGTGDPSVGSGRGQVGTDAPPKPETK
jgi:hypothetical protein